jgi:hypothetical protein
MADAKIDVASIASLALAGGALILEPMTGLTSLISRLASWGAIVISDDQIEKLGERAVSLETRVAALEQSRLPTRRLSGNPLRLLAYCLEREASQLFTYVNADEAISALSLSGDEYRDAAKELEYLQLVIVDGSANHPGGISRTRLKGRAFLSAAPALLTDIDLPGEARKVFDVLRSAEKDHYHISVTDIQKVTAIPLPRLDLLVRALIELGLLKGNGMAADEWGSYMRVEVTPAGRRALRGDDPLPDNP